MLNINKETARDILKNDLGKRKICSHFFVAQLDPGAKTKKNQLLSRFH
jgi:hypothetical protein